MRIIHYDMILSEPYYIGCNPDIRNFIGVQEPEAIKWPGMKLIHDAIDPHRHRSALNPLYPTNLTLGQNCALSQMIPSVVAQR